MKGTRNFLKKSVGNKRQITTTFAIGFASNFLTKETYLFWLNEKVSSIVSVSSYISSDLYRKPLVQ